jgi:predicted phage tail protein
MSTLTGCFYWIRAYQTYLQMDDFDQNFSITAVDEFEVFFKDPILYNDDFISLSKLQPSIKTAVDTGESWRYWFRKVDLQGNIIQPEIKFYFDLNFNKEERLTEWTFSELFLQIAPAEFLEISIRSLGGAEINKGKRQIKANTDSIEKIDTKLPQRAQMLSQLGQPLEIEHEEAQDIYHYHFQLETQDIKEGYEDRALSVVKLTFDNSTDELLKMSGRFIGLKISINYQKFVKK